MQPSVCIHGCLPSLVLAHVCRTCHVSQLRQQSLHAHRRRCAPTRSVVRLGSKPRESLLLPSEPGSQRVRTRNRSGLKPNPGPGSGTNQRRWRDSDSWLDSREGSSPSITSRWHCTCFSIHGSAREDPVAVHLPVLSSSDWLPRHRVFKPILIFSGPPLISSSRNRS